MAAAVEVSNQRALQTANAGNKFDFSVSDFAMIVTTTAFVDKTLMIRDVYNASSRILITAPRRFGKSTNIDMVKRFFEIEVENLVNKKPSNNYKLFKDNNLQICKDIEFFNEHFGKHPVLHIDFKPLDGMTDYRNVIDAFKSIVKESFNQHIFLQHYIIKHCISINSNEKIIMKYLFDGLTKDSDNVNLASSYKYLCTLLYKCFNKRVFVLIDSYEVFVETLLFKNNTDTLTKSISLIESSIGSVLNNKECVERVFITSTLPVIYEGFNKSNVDIYQFLDNHPFTKYYGLTSADLDEVLTKLIGCVDERNNVKKSIEVYYSPYESRNQRIKVYNIWSILQYVNRRIMQSYWCDRRYISTFKACFKNPLIRDRMEGLLLNDELKLDTLQLLMITDVLKLNKLITSSDIGKYPITEVGLFFCFLYRIGYLYVTKDLCSGVACLKIPNMEIKYELVKAVVDENRDFYRYNENYVDKISSCIDSFQPDNTGLSKSVLDFCNILINCYNCYYPISGFDNVNYHKRLFITLMTSGEYIQIVPRKLRDSNGHTVFMMKNKHEIAICLTTKATYSGSGQSAHEKVTDNGHEEYIFDVFNSIRGKVLIGLNYDRNQDTIEKCVTYSYYFKEGDSLRNLITLQK